jgi:superfamily I DNA/RNA helicase
VPGREARRLLGELAARKRGAALRRPPVDGIAAPACTLGRRAGRGNLEHELLERYDAALGQRGLVDFDDLLTLPVRLLDADPVLAEAYRARWPVVAVDEYQDVDAVQYRLLRLLAGAGGGLTAIGDPDQAIYGFRGADVGFFLRFGEDFPGARTVTLGRNYRSSAAIVAAAVQAVAPATLVPGRELTAAGQVPGPGRVALHRAASEQAEAEFVVRSVEELLGGASFHALDSGRASGHGDGGLSFADVAVLYRTDAQAGAIADALAKAGMPFQKRSHDRATDRPGVQAVLDRLRFEPAAEGGPVMDLVRLAAERAGAAGGRAASSTLEAGQAAGMAHTAVELLAPLAERCGHDLARFLDELALGAEVDSWDPRADRISLLTLHASKGLEFPVVFLAGCDDGLLPLRVGRAGGVDLAEERRLLFVGMTRARSYLFLSGAGRRARHGAVRDVEPSPFLADIDPALLDRLEGPRRRAARPAGDQLSLL